MRKLVFIAALIFCRTLLNAQDMRKEASVDLVSIGEAYSKINALSMNMNYNLFASPVAADPVEKHTGYYCKEGRENSYMQLYGTLTVSNKEVVMVKDDSAMVFMLKKYMPGTPAQLTHEQLVTLLTACTTVEKLKGKDETHRGYRLAFKSVMGGMEKIDFFFDNKYFFIDRIVLYYDRPVSKSYHTGQTSGYAKPRLEVEYVNVVINPVIEKTKFSTAKYLKKEKNKWELAPSYASSYEFYDQTQIKLK